MFGDWEIFGIFAGVTTTLQFFASYGVRRHFDKNKNGKIDPDEVPFLQITQDMPVKLNSPDYNDLSILSLIRTFVEAMLHSFCYGCLTVFSMNFMMSSVDRRYAYLVTCLMINMMCMFMCKYATNGIHVATSHEVHFLYYGFGYIALVFFWRKPEREYLIAVAVLFLHTIYIVGRCYSLPRYPSFYKIFRLYNLCESEWKLVPIARLGGTENDNEEMNNFEDERVDPAVTARPNPREYSKWALVFPAYEIMDPRDYNKWAVVFPVYEIMNTHISSSVSIGILSGWATSMIVQRTGIFNVLEVSNVSLGISVAIAALVVLTVQSIGLYGPVENKMHSKVLANFRPKTVATLVAMLGATTVVIQLERIPDDEVATGITYWAGVGALALNVLLTIVISVWAKLSHLGITKKQFENKMQHARK